MLATFLIVWAKYVTKSNSGREGDCFGYGLRAADYRGREDMVQEAPEALAPISKIKMQKSFLGAESVL